MEIAMKRSLVICALSIAPVVLTAETVSSKPQWISAAGARLGSVDASFRTPKGEIKSAWKYENGVCRWTYTVPAGTTATVRVNGAEKVRSAGTYNEIMR